jgi:hypothetical protein
MSTSLPILVAIPNEWGSQVCDYLKNHGFPVVATSSPDETRAMVEKSGDLRGIIIVSDWAIETQNDSNVGIIKLVQGKLPTVTLITETSMQESGYRYMDEVFFPPSHEYMTVPFDLDELAARMRKVGMV